MGKEAKKNYNLKLNLKDQVDMKYEKHIYFPLYLRGYEEALRNIFLRVLRTEDDEKTSKGSFTYVQNRDASNILSFVGERGSGKTTAMREFCQILKNVNIEEERNWWVKQTIPDTDKAFREEILNKKFYFKVLNPIDASTLEAKEDLFELLLASVYREYEGQLQKEKREKYSEMQIKEKFCKILESYHAIKNARNEDFGDSYITRLKYMSSSMDIKEKIDELVKGLLEQWCCDVDDVIPFLVIAIDDLDLNIQGGYDMLEQLHKYFFNRNIIIALAVDYGQIDLVCRTHYLQGFYKGELSAYEKYERRCKELSRDYIAKIMPMDARIFMPDVKKVKNIVVLTDEGSVTAKKYLMHKVAERMGIFYDAHGMKTHFCEAPNVRELVNYNKFLDSLDGMNYGNWSEEEASLEAVKKKMHFYDSNHERFKEDINKRLANRFLTEELKDVFEELLSKKLEQRAVYVSRMGLERLAQEDSNIQRRLTEYSDLEEYSQEYTCGELMEVIYRLGRKSEEEKALIKCLIASFTTEMVRESISYQKNPDFEEKMLSLNRLKGFLGKSFGGDWTKQLVPLCRDDMNFMTLNNYWGYSGKAQFSRIKCGFLIEAEGMFDGLLNVKDKKQATAEMTNFLAWLEKEKIVPTLEILLMFFFTKKKTDGKIGLNMEIEKNRMGTSEGDFLLVKGNNVDAIVDIMGFVEKTIGYEEKVAETQKMLAEQLADVVIKYLDRLDENRDKSKGDEYIKKILAEKVTKLSIHNKIKWGKKGWCAFPFYDFDLSYNVIKRARAELKSSNPGEISEKECYTYLKKAYEKIGELLAQEGEAYADTEYFYDKDYFSCPFMRAILFPEQYLNSDFQTILGQSVFNVMRPVHLFNIDEPEWENAFFNRS